MGWPSHKRVAGEYENGLYEFPRPYEERRDDYYYRSPPGRGRSRSPQRRSPNAGAYRSTHSPGRRYPLRSVMPRAIERPEDSAGTGIAVRQTSMARSRPARQHVTQAVPRVKNAAAVVLAEPVTWQAYEETGMLSLEQQLPQLRIRDDFYPLDKYSPPSLLSPLEPSVLEWKTVYFAGILVYIDAAAFERLKGLETGQPCRFLRQLETMQMQDLVVYRGGDHPQLVDHKELEGGNPRPPQWPSINTLSREAFNWYIGPQLSLGEKYLLDAYWAGLPRFREEMPNTVPGHPERRATPIQLPNGDWDWSEMLQPVRWFMCPCALRRHECEFTGQHLMRCQGFQAICCNMVCRHRPGTNLVHVGTVCKHRWNGKVCHKDRDCKFVHGAAVVAKGIEHRRYHHRVREL